MVSGARWESAVIEFRRAYCHAMGQPADSPLLTVTNAGSMALPTLLKMAAVMGDKRQDWDAVTQLPVEVELGNEYTYA